MERNILHALKKFSLTLFHNNHIANLRTASVTFDPELQTCFVPPWCRLSQFTPEIWLSGIDGLQMFQFLQFSHSDTLGTYGSICFPGHKANRSLYHEHPAKFSILFVSIQLCFHFSLLTLDRTCSHTFDYIPVKNKIHDQCRQDRYYDRCKCTSQSTSELPHKSFRPIGRVFIEDEINVLA